MLFRCSLAALALVTLVTASEGGPFRRRAQTVYQPYYPPVTAQPAFLPAAPAPAFAPSAIVPAGGYGVGSAPAVVAAAYTPVATTGSAPVVTDPTAGPGGDGLDEVNALRAARGLRPFVRDEGLTQAARACAAFRAANGLFGHTSNDFAFVPAGTFASSAGCAAYPAGYGWMSCCVYENYTYAGAAWVTGRDGKRYMHLFVR